MRIPIAKPSLLGNEKNYVNNCIEQNWISSIGGYIADFEKKFSEYCGVKNAITINNGTTALHVALVALGLKRGDEVIIPNVSYIATANAIAYCGATPVFVDVLPNSLLINPELIRGKITTKTKGIIPVHLYGNSADMDRINEIANINGLWVMEDAAEAHGATYKNIRVGGLADCGVFSFYGNKIITTGEGGMVTTNNDNLADKIRYFKSQAVHPLKKYWHEDIGFNYRMTNIQAAIGCAQLENIDKFIKRRAEIKTLYDALLGLYPEKIELHKSPPNTNGVNWIYNTYILNYSEVKRNALIEKLAKVGIESRPTFYPISTLPPYKEYVSSYQTSDLYSAQGINLPTFYELTDEEINYVCDNLISLI